MLQKEFPSQGGYAGQIVFHAPSGGVAAQTAAVNTAMGDVAKLPHVIKRGEPVRGAGFAAGGQEWDDRVRERVLGCDAAVVGYRLSGSAG